jgi:hypothetical protein
MINKKGRAYKLLKAIGAVVGFSLPPLGSRVIAKAWAF